MMPVITDDNWGSKWGFAIHWDLGWGEAGLEWGSGCEWGIWGGDGGFGMGIWGGDWGWGPIVSAARLHLQLYLHMYLSIPIAAARGEAGRGVYLSYFGSAQGIINHHPTATVHC